MSLAFDRPVNDNFVPSEVERRNLLARVEIMGTTATDRAYTYRNGRMEYQHSVYISGPASLYSDVDLRLLADFTARQDAHRGSMRRDSSGAFIHLFIDKDDNDPARSYWGGRRSDGGFQLFHSLGEILSYYDYPLVKPGWVVLSGGKGTQKRRSTHVTRVRRTTWRLANGRDMRQGTLQGKFFPLVAPDQATLDTYVALLAPPR